MNKIQIVSKYISLSEEGLVPVLDCPVDQGLLMCNQNINDEVYLYCLSCDYRNTIGIKFYKNLEVLIGGVLGNV